MNVESNDWLFVKPKIKKIYNELKNPSLEDLKIQINIVLSKYKPYSIYIYGSRARKTNRPDSDVDIMIFWKKYCYLEEELIQIKKELMEHLGINVDLVNMIFINKFINNYDKRDQCYYDNIKYDAINIYQIDNIELNYLLDHSIKMQKI